MAKKTVLKVLAGAAAVAGAAYVANKNKDKLKNLKDAVTFEPDDPEEDCGEAETQVDVNGDGKADVVAEDFDGDGDADAVLEGNTAYVDTTGDGVVDTVVDLDGEAKQAPTETMDTDGDGRTDTVAVDTTGDGQYDTVAVDTDGDGKLDTAFVDTTGDGVLDTTKDI
ncbi:MAG: hypothetical protein K6E13_08825 [Lachnospiraceae bacterium]|nr:hypothetical protein [Lachnospiraceae bacterium]